MLEALAASSQSARGLFIWRFLNLESWVTAYSSLCLVLGKVEYHAVSGNIRPMRQIRLPCDIIGHSNTGRKLHIVHKCSAVDAHFHALNR